MDAKKMEELLHQYPFLWGVSNHWDPESTEILVTTIDEEFLKLQCYDIRNHVFFKTLNPHWLLGVDLARYERATLATGIKGTLKWFKEKVKLMHFDCIILQTTGRIFKYTIFLPDKEKTLAQMIEDSLDMSFMASHDDQDSPENT
ncbi:MAG: hypothetical protein NTZ49_03630 [Candidatus Parcubacteria bacterium]|nr:hypothetical protein [Candidatus Parcubacteria bacterium]